MPVVVTFLLIALVAYLIGAIPPGYLYVKWVKRQDVRTIQSGRTGGTNVLRAAGVAAGVITALSDVLKGAGAVWATQALFAPSLAAENLPWAQALAGLSAVVGHNWSIYIGFAGGAGTTPNVGWASTVWWPIFPINLVVGVVLMWQVGIASVTSLVVCALIPIVFAIRYLAGHDASPAYLVGAIVCFLTVAWSLRPNIRRLLAGEERVVGPRARQLANKRPADPSGA